MLEIGWGHGGWAEMQFAGRLVEVFGDLLGKLLMLGHLSRDLMC